MSGHSHINCGVVIVHSRQFGTRSMAELGRNSVGAYPDGFNEWLGEKANTDEKMR